MSPDRHRIGLVAFVLALLVWAAPVAGDVVFEIETRDLASGTEAAPGRMAVSGMNITVDISEGGGERSSAIYRGEERELVAIDHEDRTYFVLDGSTMEALGGQISAAMKQMEAALANLPPEQREMAERMMKQQMGQLGAATASGPQMEFVNTGERATKSGYPCVKYIGRLGDEILFEMWVARWSDVKGAQEAKDAFESLGEFASELMSSVQEMAGGMLGAIDFGNPFEAFDEIDGFPVVTRSFEGGRPSSETVLREVRKEKVDPAAFEPPTGYRRQTMDGRR